MAMIPDVDISTRKLETSPDLHYFQSLKGENARAVAGAVGAVGNAVDQIWAAKIRGDEREAEYAVLLADNDMNNRQFGTDTQDPATGKWTHAPGLFDRTWQEWQNDQTTVLDENKKALADIRERDYYKNLSAYQRKIFERKWRFRADAHTRAAQQQQIKLHQQRIVDETKRNIEYRGSLVGRVYGADDTTYKREALSASLRNWADLQGTALTEQSRALLDDPRCTFADIAKSQKWDERTTAQKLEEYRKTVLGFDVNRITALTRAGENDVALGVYGTAGQMDPLEKAKQIADGLKKEGYASDAQYNDLIENIKAAENKRDYLRNQKQQKVWKEEREKTQEKEIEIAKREIPQEPKARAAYYETVANEYTAMANNPNLSPADQLQYARTAQRLKQGEIVAENNENFDREMADYEAGCYFDENGEQHDYDSITMQNTIRQRYNEGKYTLAQRNQALLVADKAWDDESKQVRDHVISLAKQVTPYAIYNQKRNRFEFKGDGKKTIGSETPFEFTVHRGTQNATYGELVKAMNLTLKWRKTKGASVEEANQYFDRLVDGTVRAQQQANIEETLKYENQVINAFGTR